jgi:tRNA(fMet)-specific endonuclease VapC
MKYLLDTCTVSDLFKRDVITLEHFKNVAPADLSLSSITVMEIEYGLKLNPSREQKIRPFWHSLLDEIHVFSFDYEEARCASMVRVHLRNQMIGAYDCMIAGTALAHGLCVVTSNIREFTRLEELTLENWRLADRKIISRAKK